MLVRRTLPFLLLALLPSCEEEHSCTLAGCGPPNSPELPLVDENGSPVIATGETRMPARLEPRPFRCTGQKVEGAPCGSGVLRLPPVGGTLAPGDALEVHFALDDGSWTEWQSVEASYQEHLEPDFNGPGCDCTWLSVTLAPAVVPSNARLSPQGEYLSP